MDCSPPGSFVHGISQASILGWVAISSSRGSFWSRDWTLISCVSCIGRQVLCHWATWEAYRCLWGAIIHPTIGVFPALVFLSLRITSSSTTRIEPCSPMYCTSWPELPEPWVDTVSSGFISRKQRPRRFFWSYPTQLQRDPKPSWDFNFVLPWLLNVCDNLTKTVKG